MITIILCVGGYILLSYLGVWYGLHKGGGGPGGLAWLILPAAPLLLPIGIFQLVMGGVKRIFR